MVWVRLGDELFPHETLTETCVLSPRQELQVTRSRAGSAFLLAPLTCMHVIAVVAARWFDANAGCVSPSPYKYTLCVLSTNVVSSLPD